MCVCKVGTAGLNLQEFYQREKLFNDTCEFIASLSSVTVYVG